MLNRVWNIYRRVIFLIFYKSTMKNSFNYLTTQLM